MSNSIIRGNDEDMPDKWLEPEAYKKALRLLTIKKMQGHIPSKCPECKTHTLHHEEDGEVYCMKCGLVVMDTYPYVAGTKIEYPYGLRLS